MRNAVIFGALLVAACSQAASTPVKPERPSQYVRIIDGDTLTVRGEKVRISNIDAPELPPRAKCWAEGALAVQAARQAQEFINVSPTLRLDRQGKDQYGRTLARVVLARDSDLGEAMVFAGVAAKWAGHRWDWCSSTNFTDSNGPSFLSGVAGNPGFSDWAISNADAATTDAAHDAGFSDPPLRAGGQGAR